MLLQSAPCKGVYASHMFNHICLYIFLVNTECIMFIMFLMVIYFTLHVPHCQKKREVMEKRRKKNVVDGRITLYKWIIYV